MTRGNGSFSGRKSNAGSLHHGKRSGAYFFGRYSAPCSNFRRALRLSQPRSHWTPSFGNFGAEDGTQDGICAGKPIAVRLAGAPSRDEFIAHRNGVTQQSGTHCVLERLQ